MLEIRSHPAKARLSPARACGLLTGGASAFGAFLISNPLKVVKAAFAGALALFKGPRYKREDYLTLLKLLHDVLQKIRKAGLLGIEGDIERPRESALFQKYPSILGDHHLMEFITDCLRLMAGGNMNPHELESLLEYELETHHKDALEPAHAVQKVADALPGFGMAPYLASVPNRISITGHTDATPYVGTGGYSNWELSSDRANAARRILVASGLPEARIGRIVGLADSAPMDRSHPFSPVNRFSARRPRTSQAVIPRPPADRLAVGHSLRLMRRARTCVIISCRHFCLGDWTDWPKDGA